MSPIPPNIVMTFRKNIDALRTVDSKLAGQLNEIDWPSGLKFMPAIDGTPSAWGPGLSKSGWFAFTGSPRVREQVICEYFNAGESNVILPGAGQGYGLGLLLFFGIAVLEDSGYMARAAFIMDRFMHRIGLHGKSFIPMLIGFGCSVPAIMATRILENKRDRLTTMMVVPLMSCGARMPIYALFIPAFFPKVWQAPLLWLIYVIGIIVAASLAKLLRISLFKGENAGLVMELPPYRIPTLKGLLMHMWHRGWQYLKKVGTVILAMSIVLWAMANYPKMSSDQLQQYQTPQAQASAQMEYSIIGRLGHAIEPAIKPLGFDWRVGTALISALPAKEMFVAQMGIVFASAPAPENEENPDLIQQLRSNYSPLAAFCIMIFSLLAAPCMATIAVTRKEAGSWGWALAQFFGLTATGYLITLLIYQIGSAIITIAR